MRIVEILDAGQVGIAFLVNGPSQGPWTEKFSFV